MKRSRFWQSFFIEMAMVVLFFSLAVAVIIRFFAQGALLSKKSKEVNGAILAAQTVAQTFEKTEVSQSYTLFFDQNWKQTDQPSSFEMRILLEPTESGNGILCDCDIDVYKSQTQDLLFQLSTNRYFAQEGAK